MFVFFVVFVLGFSDFVSKFVVGDMFCLYDFGKCLSFRLCCLCLFPDFWCMNRFPQFWSFVVGTRTPDGHRRNLQDEISINHPSNHKTMMLQQFVEVTVGLGGLDLPQARGLTSTTS